MVSNQLALFRLLCGILSLSLLRFLLLLEVVFLMALRVAGIDSDRQG